ncbi:hypothetical protein WOLCODRAFT_102051 [Wolfiporia cocos MD-104 SS10]|uniref:Uncharacterized protein n=1 Tax=Wolfiporia cocos (strain MD-104) TaxID=742152 RepID=A0A2H3JJN2_WOLCO|nr:hypothetical protein WOLCODRAFT_102051 [Wolfiporia cocos MD-104 SS10]
MDDALFFERLETVLDKSLHDLRAFADREHRPFEEVRERAAEWHCKYLLSRPSTGPSSDLREHITSTLKHTSQTLETLHSAAGMHSFFLVVNPANPTDDGFLGGTVQGREFWRGHRGCGVAGARAFKAHCLRAAEQQTRCAASGSAAPPLTSVPPLKKGPAGSLKAEVYARVREALRAVSGVRNADMKWRDHSRLEAYGVRVVGWPEDVPTRNPSELSVEQNRQVLEALKSGRMSFVRMAPETTPPLDPALRDESLDLSWAYNDPYEEIPAQNGSFNTSYVFETHDPGPAAGGSNTADLSMQTYHSPYITPGHSDLPSAASQQKRRRLS